MYPYIACLTASSASSYSSGAKYNRKPLPLILEANPPKKQRQMNEKMEQHKPQQVAEHTMNQSIETKNMIF